MDDKELEYMLPHFLMIIAGKPGSGKTHLLQEMLNNEDLYKDKFNDIFIFSPSFAKMNVKIPLQNFKSTFDLDWLFDKLQEIN